MNALKIVFISLCALICEELVRLNIGVKRAGDFFVIRGDTISQRLNSDGKKQLKYYRKEQQEKYLETKIIALGKMLLKEMPILFEKMEIGKTYLIHTHLKSYIKHSAKKYNLEIISAKSTGKRLLVESILYLGVEDFLKIIFSKKRKRLWKQFYKMKIKKM